ncbi:replication associated protein [Miresoil virus 422]|uniref:Replication associated protein n=1 Tax=Miresoil virus 422 TaxID=2911460 RepID=A0A9E8Z1C2_9VIRU|nr:replication associated protein [Miresoil virus 422]
MEQTKGLKCQTVVFTSYMTEEATQAILGKVDWYVYGREIAPTTGAPHLQGMAWTKNPSTWGFLSKVMHVEKCISPTASVVYCKKDNDYFEMGTPPKWAKPKEEKLKVVDLQNMTEDQWGQLGPSQYNASTKALAHWRLAFKKPVARDSVCGEWFVGKPGTGKSHTARLQYPGAYIKSYSKWWEGYKGEEFVICEDMDAPALGHLLKLWADKYPCWGEIKGAALPLMHTKFIVTSNYTIEEIWEKEPKIAEALLDRFTVTVFLKKYRHAPKPSAFGAPNPQLGLSVYDNNHPPTAPSGPLQPSGDPEWDISTIKEDEAEMFIENNDDVDMFFNVCNLHNKFMQ